MKKNLGSLIAIILLFSALYAEDFTYTLDVNKKDPYLKEPIIVSLKIKQTDHKHVLFFNFDINKSNDYLFFKSKIEESGKKHSLQIKYTYVLYPLKSGHIDILFNLVKRVTTDASIAYGFSGDRDNTRGMTTIDTPITIPPLSLNVKAVPSNTDIVGDFTLDYHIDKIKTTPYAPINFSLEIKGEGYYPTVKSIIAKNKTFTLFKDKAITHFSHTDTNMEGSLYYPFALSGAKNFSLNAIEIYGFNPKTEKSYTLQVPRQEIQVVKNEKDPLIDSIESPPPLRVHFNWLYDLLKIIFVFAVGYLTALAIRLTKKREKITPNNVLHSKIAATKNSKDLMRILLASGDKKYFEIIEKIEDNLYGNGKMNFKSLKREALEKRDA